MTKINEKCYSDVSSPDRKRLELTHAIRTGKKITPAIRWRDNLLDLMVMGPQKIETLEDPYTYLLQTFDLEYNKSKQEMQSWREQAGKRKLSKHEQEQQLICSRGIYLASVALLSFGRMEVVEDILPNAPPGEYPIRHYLSILRDLFPLPADLKTPPQYAWADIVAWVLQNRELLGWSEEEGRFVTITPQE